MTYPTDPRTGLPLPVRGSSRTRPYRPALDELAGHPLVCGHRIGEVPDLKGLAKIAKEAWCETCHDWRKLTPPLRKPRKKATPEGQQDLPPF